MLLLREYKEKGRAGESYMGKQTKQRGESRYSLQRSREKRWSNIKGFLNLTDRKLKKIWHFYLDTYKNKTKNFSDRIDTPNFPSNGTEV